MKRELLGGMMAIGALALLAGLAITLAVWRHDPSAVAPRQPAPSKAVPVAASQPTAEQILQQARQQALARAQRSLLWAEEASLAQVGPKFVPLNNFFLDLRGHTPEFAADVLSLSSKWRYVADRVPMTDGDRHDKFLRAAFAKHLFTEEQLQQAIEQVARGYADELTAIENQMLVRLRNDLEGLPGTALPSFADGQTLADAYQSAVAEALEHVGADVRADLATLMVALVTEEVLTQVAVRMGVSAGILGAGAGSSWATLGVGLVVGLIVDRLVSWVWDWVADPQGDLAAAMNTKLAELHTLIVDGDGTSIGLHQRLMQLARDRALIRRQAVTQLILQTPGT